MNKTTIFLMLLFMMMSGCDSDREEITKKPHSSSSREACFKWIRCPTGEGVSNAVAVSADGMTVVGACLGNPRNKAFRWNLITGIQLLPGMENALDVSGNGEVIAGAPGRVWTQTTGTVSYYEWRGRPEVSKKSLVTAIHNDGNRAAGVYRDEPGVESDEYNMGFWDQGITGSTWYWSWLGPNFYTDDDEPVRAHKYLYYHEPVALSANGKVLVGIASPAFDLGEHDFTEFFISELNENGLPGRSIFPDTLATHPRKETGAFTGPNKWTISRSYRSVASDVSSDGRVVVGTVIDGNSMAEGFRWTKEIGMKLIGKMEGDSFTWANAITATGNTIIGNSGRGAFIYSEAWGFPHPLKEYLMLNFDLEDELQSVALNSAVDISDKGKVIVGNGSFNKRVAIETFKKVSNAWINVEVSGRLKNTIEEKFREGLLAEENHRFARCLIDKSKYK